MTSPWMNAQPAAETIYIKEMQLTVKARWLSLSHEAKNIFSVMRD